MFYWIIIIALIVVGLFIYLKTYHLDYRKTITAYTGGVGSGKTFLSVRQVIRSYKKNLARYKRQKVLSILTRKKVEKPILYSNVPIIYKNKFTSCELTSDIVLLQKRIPEGSVVMIDEVSGFLNQFEYQKNGNVKLFDEFCRFFRQYVGGVLVINDQCSANVVLQIRRRLNTIYNLSKHRYFCKITWVKVREINISEEIVSIDQKDTNETYNNFFCFGNFFKFYDSRCYKPRYLLLDYVDNVPHTEKTTLRLFTCPDHVYKSIIEERIEILNKSSQEGSVTPEGDGTSAVDVDIIDEDML